VYYKGAKEAPYSFINADARHLLVNRPVLICVKSGNECNGVHEEGLRNTVHLFVFNITVQGGSDISGTLSKLHSRIKKSSFLLIILHKTVSALCKSGKENKQKLSAKDESTGSYESCDSLWALRRMERERDFKP
jgi:hypothetical protein